MTYQQYIQIRKKQGRYPMTKESIFNDFQNEAEQIYKLKLENDELKQVINGLKGRK